MTTLMGVPMARAKRAKHISLLKGDKKTRSKVSSQGTCNKATTWLGKQAWE
jgi:hypothetical protein